jgi:hypothetical protein
LQSAIVWPSCFDANAGIFEALLGEQDAVISDTLNHASIIDGIRLCKAKRFRCVRVCLFVFACVCVCCADVFARTRAAPVCIVWACWHACRSARVREVGESAWGVRGWVLDAPRGRYDHMNMADLEAKLKEADAAVRARPGAVAAAAAARCGVGR